MFKLAGLFVEIKANDAPVQASLSALKGKIGAMGSSITSSLSGALTSGLSAIPGPVGTAASAVQGLLSLLGEGNEDVEKIGAVWESAMSPIRGLVGAAVHSVADLVGKAAESGGLIETATAGVAAVASTARQAFSALAAPIGAITELLSGVFTTAKAGGDQFAELGYYFAGAMTPIVEVFTEVGAAISEWIAKLGEGAQSSTMFTSAVEAIGSYTEAAFDNVKTAIDQGVASFIVLKSAAEDLFESAQMWFESFQADAQAAFAGPAMASVIAWGSAVQEWIVDKAALVGIAVRNWPDIFELAALQIEEKLINIGEYMGTIPFNAQIVGNYLATNWRAFVIDSVAAVGSAFHNLGENIGKIAYAIAEFIRNPTGGLKFEWTALLDGFKATAEKLPELLKPKLTDMGDQFREIADRIAERERVGFEGHAKREKDAAVAEKAKAVGPEKDKFKSTSFASADFASRIRAAIYNQGGDDVPKQQLDAQKKTAQATTEIAEAMKKPKPAVLG